MSTIDPKAVWPGWETVRLIGRGSFGAVYEIQRDVFGETEKAALKMISIPQSDSDISEMRSDGYDDESITSTFQAHLRSIVAEYSLMRKLNGSANVVNCDDVRYVQHKNGFGWDILIKMELLTPLTQALPGEISEEQVVKIGKDLARALVQCRQFDIVHRDIKPQNIFVSPLGDYKLGDFGIAKTVEKTSGGTKIGTYKYMAPEVYNNQPYGAGADIYSLGLVLYWLLNERRMPFLPLPPAKLGAGMEEQARLRRFRGEQIPAPLHGSEALKQIVLKCCAFDPKDRFANAEELLQALEKAEKNSEFGIRSSEVERKELSAPVGAAAPGGPRKPEAAAPEDETVGVFGVANPAGAAISRPPVTEQAPDEDATVSATMPVGADALGGLKPTTDGNGLPRAPAPTPETAVPEEDATVGVFGAVNPVGAAISRPPVKEQAPDEDATVSAAMPVGADAPGGPRKTDPAPIKKPQPVQPQPVPQPASPVTGKKSGGKGKLIGILAAALVIIAVAVILAVIVMVTARPDGLDNPATTGQGTITAPTPTPTPTPDPSTVIVQPPTPSPTPTPVPESVKVFFFEDEKDEFTEKVGESVKLHAVAYPVNQFPNGPYQWSVNDESVVKLTVSEDTKECEVLCLKHQPGGVTLTVSCNGVEKKVIVYTKP